MLLRMLTLTSLAAAALVARSPAQSTYVIGGPAASLQPSSGALGWDGAAMANYRAAVEDPANFGPAGVHGTTIQTRSLAVVGVSSLDGLDAFVCPSWEDSELSQTQIDTIVDFFLDGGDLILIGDDYNHDAVAAKLGLTVRIGFNETAAETAAPLGKGDFGALAGNSVPLSSPGYLDVARVKGKNGHLGAVTPLQTAAAAWWSKGDFGPNTGALLILCDPGLVTDGNYGNVDARARYALNATAFLADRTQVRVLGGPAANLQPSSGVYRWETGAGIGDIKYALSRDDLFHPGQPGGVDVQFHFFNDFNAASLHLCDTFIVPFWKDSDLSTTHRNALKAAYAGGMNLMVWLDQTNEAALLSDLGLNVQTNGETAVSLSMPLSWQPFGGVVSLTRPDPGAVLDSSSVIARNGTISARDPLGAAVGAYWQSGDLPGYQGRMLVITEPGFISDFTADFINLNSEARVTLGAFHLVLTDRVIRVAGPAANLNTSPDGWAGAGMANFRAALTSDGYFAPSGRSSISLVCLDMFTMDEVLLSTMDVFVTGHWSDSELYGPHLTLLQEFVHRGGRLLMMVDDLSSDNLCAAFGLIARNGVASTTTGTAPAYNGMFGAATAAYQTGNVVVFDSTFVPAMGGQVIGTNGLGQASVIWLKPSSAASGSGDVIAVGDVDMFTLANYNQLIANSIFALNTVNHLARSEPKEPVEYYGQGHPGAGGFIPTLRARGTFGDSTMASLRIDHGVGRGVVFLLMGTTGRLNFSYRDATVLVNFPWYPMSLNLGGTPGAPGEGSVGLSGRVPPGLLGLPQGVNLQALIFDSQASRGLAASEGVEIR